MGSVNSKYTNEILDDIQTYELVLQRKIKQFPSGFWTKPWSYESATKITRYLLEKKLQLKIEDIPSSINMSTFRDNKLSGMVSLLYDNSAIKAVQAAYPNKFKLWEFRTVLKGFWKEKDNVGEAIRWLIEEKLKWGREDIVNNFSIELLQKHKMESATTNFSLYAVIELAYPGEFKPWELKVLARGFWDNTDNVIWAMRWLIEEKLKWTREDICKKYSRNTLGANCLWSLTSKYSLYDLINMTYPNEFKPWELNVVPRGYWSDKNNLKNATKWLVEEKLKCKTKQDVITNFNMNTLRQYNLASMIKDNSLYDLIELAYPNKFKPDDFRTGRRLAKTKLDNSRYK